MKKLILISGILSLSILGLAGCETTDTTVTNSALNSNSADNVNMANMNSNTAVVVNENTNVSKVADDDGEEFMKTAAQGGMSEVKLGELAASKAQNADVKAFAKKMVEDHSKANSELKALAEKKKFTLPTSISEDQQEAYDELAKLSGAEFDKKYVEMMVEDHEEDVEAFQEQADDGEDADIKAFAAKTLPTLKSHYEMIKGISDKMDK